EDGIRDATVTGVQTCALPIWKLRQLEPVERQEEPVGEAGVEAVGGVVSDADVQLQPERLLEPRRVLLVPGRRVHEREEQLEPGRSEERRGGKECMRGGGRCGW